MRTYQKFMCIGRMGKDPESFQAGSSLKANLSVATSKSYKDSSGEWQESTDWHSVELWNEQASKVLDVGGPRKGDLVLIEGEVRYNQYQAQDGTTRYATSIRAFVCSIMERHQPAPQQAQAQAQAAQYQPQAPQYQHQQQQQYNPQPQHQQQQQQYNNAPAPNFNNTPAQPARQRNQSPPAQAPQPQQQIDYSQDLPF